MFVVATGLIAKYSETLTKGWAAAALTFLFLYVFWLVFEILVQSKADILPAMPASSTSTVGQLPRKSSRPIFAHKALELRSPR